MKVKENHRTDWHYIERGRDISCTICNMHQWTYLLSLTATSLAQGIHPKGWTVHGKKLSLLQSQANGMAPLCCLCCNPARQLGKCLASDTVSQKGNSYLQYRMSDKRAKRKKALCKAAFTWSCVHAWFLIFIAKNSCAWENHQNMRCIKMLRCNSWGLILHL